MIGWQHDASAAPPCAAYYARESSAVSSSGVAPVVHGESDALGQNSVKRQIEEDTCMIHI